MEMPPTALAQGLNSERIGSVMKLLISLVSDKKRQNTCFKVKTIGLADETIGLADETIDLGDEVKALGDEAKGLAGIQAKHESRVTRRRSICRNR